ncbi:MAG: 2OG-Fe(II) oxygenase [Deltaproteobacteria bacterium]|nr:2OG-Fe(II) oxygenase [Deltaproteobacteria bacterium]
MQPIYSVRPFASPATCFVVPRALEARECGEIVEAATRLGFEPMGVDYPPSYRDNDRLVMRSTELATLLFARLRAALPEELVDEAGHHHRLVGLNERFRLCRYRGGQSFRIHQDGAYAPRAGVCSRLTLQIYLDAGFSGGRTRFYAARRGNEIGAILPEAGSAAVFDHLLWHDGEAVTAGTKHVMRTDVLYERTSPAAPITRESDRDDDDDILRGHEGYVFVVRGLTCGALASGSRDRTIRLWRRAPRGSWSCEQVLAGHEASVLALAELSGGVLLSGSRDRTVRAWRTRGGDSAPKGEVVATLGGAVLALEDLGDGSVACASSDGSVVRIGLDRGGGDVLGPLRGHDGWVWSLARLPGGRLVSGSADGTIRMWSTSTGACLASRAPGRGAVHAVATLKSGAVAAAFADGHVVVYDADDALAPVSVHRASDGEIYALHPLACGGFAAGGEEACVRALRGVGASESAEEIARADGFVRSICDVPGTRRLAVAGYDGCVRLVL